MMGASTASSSDLTLSNLVGTETLTLSGAEHSLMQM